LSTQVFLNFEINSKIKDLEKQKQNKQILTDDSFKLGQLYLTKKMYDKAIELFREVLKNWNQEDVLGLGSLYNTLGFTYFTLKEYDFAIYYYQQALKLLPDYVVALNNLAFVYEKQNLKSKAKEIYLRVLKIDPLNKLAKEKITV
jgi:tetratricopeptide (TPR) repeat protein